MKIVYTGPERGGVFAPGVMNQVFYPGVAVDAPDKPATHSLLNRPDFERAADDAETVLPDYHPDDVVAEPDDEDEAEPELRGSDEGEE